VRAREQIAVSLSDGDRERLIEAYRIAIELEPNQSLKRSTFGRMAALIGERSPEQVRRMERERGLA
jgi:hypothetical protein